MSALVFASNCSIARMLPGEADWCRSEQVGQGGQKGLSALSSTTDRILRYIKTTFLTTFTSTDV